ncbi:MAG: hypothetical protein MJY55_00735 [Bacteroidales bacterium]|nr:hypothetical protein [Bacteroidales bacterium]
MKIPFSDQAYDRMLASLFVRYPSFGSVGAGAYKPGLERMREMCRRMGDPQTKFRSIHVAGTNGKGSTCNMLAADFAASGLKTGLYTSPHILDFRERARIIETDRERAGRGESQVTLIPREAVWDFIQSHNGDIEELNLSFFEITTAMAFDWFASCNVDIAVIETGLGGRLDATNVITPELSVITNIGYDHMDLLGPTLSDIAGEKAGIIKPGVPVVIGESGPESDPVFTRRAASLSSPLTFTDAGGFTALPQDARTPIAGAIGPSHCFAAGRCSENIQIEKSGPSIRPGVASGFTESICMLSARAEGLEPAVARVQSDSMAYLTTRCDSEADQTIFRGGRFQTKRSGVPGTGAPGEKSFRSASDSSGTAEGLDLKGSYQAKNLNTVLTALKVLGREPDMAAISHAAAICHFHGRWETLLESPKTICDIGHNEHGLKYNFRQLDDLLDNGTYTDLVMVYGSVKDKDVDAVLKILPQRAHIIFTAADNHRAMPAGELLRRAAHKDAEIGGSVSESVRKALDRCKALEANAGRNGTLAKPLLYIGGSTYVVSEAVAYMNGDRNNKQ